MGPRVSVALFLRQAVWTVQMIQAEQEPDRTLSLAADRRRRNHMTNHRDPEEMKDEEVITDDTDNQMSFEG